MKKYFIRVAVGITLIIFVVFLYYNFFSLSSVLNDYSFSKKDIITSKDYSSDSNEKHMLFLLSNKEKLGLITAKKNKYGLWSKGIASVTNDLSNDNFITLSIVTPKGWGEDYFSEKSILIASYIDEIVYTDDLLTTKDFHLNIENFEVNDSKLLLVEATVGKNRRKFGSEGVIQYLQKKINLIKK